MFNYNVYFNYDDDNAELLKKYNLDEDSEVFESVWSFKFPYLFKKGDIIRIDNFINCFNGRYHAEDIMAKVETVEFDLYLETDLAGIDVNICLEII